MPKLRVAQAWILRNRNGRAAAFVFVSAVMVFLLLEPRGHIGWYRVLVLPLAIGVVAMLCFRGAATMELVPNPSPSGDREHFASTILKIVDSSLPILRSGLSTASAAHLARVLVRELGFHAIAITDTERILAYEGVGSEHHLPGDLVATHSTRMALRTGQVTVAQTRAEIGCSDSHCRLQCGVIAPLMVSGKAVGAIKFYRTAPEGISDGDRELAAELSRLLSTQLELNEIEVQRRLAAEAQMRALKAQIHPHFIFNVLNTISSACVVDPQVARTVVLRLSSLLRRTFRIRTEYITLQEELALVREYLEIESIRFPEMISYHEEVDSEVMRCLVPVLILQPLVENCVIHGLRAGRIHVILRAHLANDRVHLEIEDDGPGLSGAELAALNDPESSGLEGVGIHNTRRRLQALAGDRGTLQVESGSPGVRIVVALPVMRADTDTRPRRDLAYVDSPRR